MILIKASIQMTFESQSSATPMFEALRQEKSTNHCCSILQGIDGVIGVIGQTSHFFWTTFFSRIFPNHISRISHIKLISQANLQDFCPNIYPMGISKAGEILGPDGCGHGLHWKLQGEAQRHGDFLDGKEWESQGVDSI